MSVPQATMAQQQDQSQSLGNSYVKVKRLGSGAYGEVILARHRQTREEVAIKVTSSKFDPITMKYLEAEILNQRRLQHPHIVGLKEVVHAGPNQIGIVMEYASGGSLFHFVQKQGRLKESDARWFFQQLVMTLDYIHGNKVAHRDIKLENLLLNPVPGVPLPLLKMCDFGFSKLYDQHQPCISKVGTLAYMAPEMFTGDGYDGSLADVWSCGVVLYVMLVGQYPFGAAVRDADKASVMQRVVSGKWSIPSDLKLSAECLELLKRILEPNPAQRLNMDGVMSHPWFLANLPPGALEYNRNVKNVPLRDRPSEEDIKRVLGTYGR